MQRGLPLRPRWEFASSYRSFVDPVKNTSQQRLLTDISTVQARKITTKHDSMIKQSIRCLSFCVPCWTMPYECHMVSLQGSFADDSLIYESLLCLLVSFESFNHLHVFDWPSIRPPVHTSSDLCQVRSKSKQIKL